MEKRYPVTILAPLTLPLDERFNFDEVIFRKSIRKAKDAGITCMYTFGTAGEGYAVTDKLFCDVTKVFIDEFSGPGIRPMTGILGLSAYHMLERIEMAKALGCRDFQIGTPAWGALSWDEIQSFFHMICDAHPDCAFMHYNNGPRSKTLVTVAQYVELAREIPNLVASKYSTMNLYEIRSIVTADCPITFYLVDNGFCYGSMMGTCGYLASFAEVDYALSWKQFKAAQDKDYAELVKMDAYIAEIAAAFSIVDGPKIDAAYDKAVTAATLPGMSQRLFPPYQGLSDDELAHVKNVISAVLKKYA